MNEFPIVFLLTLLGSCLAEDSPVTLNDISSVNQCDNTEEVAKVCIECSSLPFDVFTPLTTCCSEKNAFLFCEACVKDQTSCKTLMEEIEEVNSFSDEQDTGVDDYANEYQDYVDNTLQRPLPLLPSGVGNIEKRYGKLFVSSPKRYGSIFFGKRSDDGFEDIDKRYGRLYMGSGSYFGKRDTMDKRYGRLYMNSNGLFGKRGGDMEDLDNAYMDDVDVDKRYGRVYMGGNRYNRLFGKRDLDGGMYDKRYGRIFMGGKGLFGKRGAERDFQLDYPQETDDLEKRFGQLYVSRNRYNMRPKFSQMDKRYGRLFTGRRRGKTLFG